MKRLLASFLLCACACAAAPAAAQDAGSPEALRAAQELAAIVTSDTIAQLSRNMTAQMWPNIEAQLGGKVDSATLAEMRSEFENAISSFTTDTMKDVPAIYAKYFTVQQLHDLLAFYKTPTGAKALKTMPQVTAEITGQMMPHMQSFQADLVARLQAIMHRHGYKD